MCEQFCGSDDTADDGCDGTGGTCGEGCKECQAGVCTECIKSYGLDGNGVSRLHPNLFAHLSVWHSLPAPVGRAAAGSWRAGGWLADWIEFPLSLHL